MERFLIDNPMFHTNLVRWMRIKNMYDDWPKHFCHNEEKPWLNVSESQMRRIMKNECEPTLRTKMKLSGRLGVELFELTKRDDKEEGKKEAPDDFDKFFDEGFRPMLELIYKSARKKLFWSRVKWSVISILPFIAVSAWFAMLFVALLS